MAQILNVPMTQDLDLPDGWTVRVTAVDSAGAVVSAVQASEVSIVADAPLGNISALEVGPFLLVPGPEA